jgi:hypothetical protein
VPNREEVEADGWDPVGKAYGRYKAAIGMTCA